MPSPPQPSAMQDTTTLKLCTDLWNHFTSLRSKNWHSACRLSPTPTSFTTTINIGQCICWWFDGSTTFRGNGRHPTHEVHRHTLFWCSTNWPSTFCVTIQPTIFPVKHHPSSFDFAPHLHNISQCLTSAAAAAAVVQQTPSSHSSSRQWSSTQASSSLLPICRAKAFVKARRGEEPMQALLNAYGGPST